MALRRNKRTYDSSRAQGADARGQRRRSSRSSQEPRSSAHAFDQEQRSRARSARSQASADAARGQAARSSAQRQIRAGASSRQAQSAQQGSRQNRQSQPTWQVSRQAQARQVQPAHQSSHQARSSQQASRPRQAGVTQSRTSRQQQAQQQRGQQQRTRQSRTAEASTDFNRNQRNLFIPRFDEGQGNDQSASAARREAASASGSARRQQGSRTRQTTQRQQVEAPEMTSTSVEELRRADRRAQGEKKARKTRRRRIALVAVIVGVVVALAVGLVALYNSPAFTIEEVNVSGVEHLTSDEMSQLANVPADATLLRVDTDTIVSRLKQSAWVKDVQIERVFPNTLQINVTERPVAAIVEIPISSTKGVKKWAIADDYIWLMPIPDVGSDAAKTTSSQIYEDDKTVMHIVDLPYGTKAEIGETCTDSIVNNALDIVSGMTTELADQVVQISAASTAETTLILDNGVEIAFGKAEDIRDKERVVLQILEENPDNVSYINVRMVETPTWRSI